MNQALIILMADTFLPFIQFPAWSVTLASGSQTPSFTLKNSEYDQEIPQSQTADNSVAPRGRAAQPSRDTRKTN